MISASLIPVPSLAEAVRWTPAQIVELAQANAQTQHQLARMQVEFETLKHQLEWFKRQIFGQAGMATSNMPTISPSRQSTALFVADCERYCAGRSTDPVKDDA